MNNESIVHDLLQAKKGIKTAIRKLKASGNAQESRRLKRAISDIDKAIWAIKAIA